MARKKRKGSPPGEVYWWERALAWVSQWANKLAAFLIALGQAAFEFFRDNQSALMAAAPFWLAAACLIVLGALYSSKKTAEVKAADNTERQVL